ncbi:acyl carrier protein [Pseudorhodobacter antarcticus]|uniref:Acyl carrier protein n=1 Tax=Pseudorhodobacter antarcticus TaxID=1077947 RepID=A0A1H8JWQ5_9RHOB|nr:phosphopantetheine-binding protein [Pseudorhodobacter antarcticus]SEN84696.1 acyl carrier protein [Pseudorhodobacter antarcticus]
MTVEERVRAIIAEQAMLDVADISLDCTLESLGVDSLALVEAIFAIEEAFDISVPFNANTPEDSGFDLTSVRTIVAAVQGLIDAQTA